MTRAPHHLFRFSDWNSERKLLSTPRLFVLYFDRIFFDIKCLDSHKHEQVTGVPNRKILENFRRLRTAFPEVDVTVRTPVIQGVNDAPDDIRAIVEFVNDVGGATAYELLPYHGLGEPKYARLGKHYGLSHLQPPSDERMKGLQSIAHGVRCHAC